MILWQVVPVFALIVLYLSKKYLCINFWVSGFNKDEESIHCYSASVIFSETAKKNATVVFTYQTGDEIQLVETNNYITPIPNISIIANQTKAVSINITSTGVGHLNLGINSSSEQFIG